MPPFEGSDVPLEEDILKPKSEKEFKKNWLEWVADNKTQITRSASGTALQNLFIVPERKTLFITDAWVTTSDSDFDQQARIILDGLDIARVAGGVASLVLSFRMPLKAESGAVINYEGHGGATPAASQAGGIVGFLIDKKIS